MDKWILKTISDDLFTDREDWLDYLYGYGVKLGEGKPFGSIAILGLRRLGKTELFRRVYNLLFFKQDKVVPIFWTYESKNLINPDFSFIYLENFLKQYFSFKNREKYQEIYNYELSGLFEYGLNIDKSEGIERVIGQFKG